MTMGCATERIDGVERPLTREAGARLGCRAEDRADVADGGGGVGSPRVRRTAARNRLARAYTHHPQHRDRLVGCLAALRPRRRLSSARQARSRAIPPGSRWWLVGARRRRGDRLGYLPVLEARAIPINPRWAGQEATAFPDNWSDRPELLPQRVRARAQRSSSTPSARRRRATPDADSGLRNPGAAREPVVRYRDVTRRRALRGGAPRRRRGDREDPHDRVDAAAALRRAALPRPCAPTGTASSTARPARCTRVSEQFVEARPAHGDAEQADQLVLGLRRRGRASSGSAAARISTADAAVRGRTRRGPTRWSLQNPDHVNGGDEPLRLAVQLPRGVRHRLPAAPAACPTSSSTASCDDDPNVDPREDSGRGHVPRPGDGEPCAGAGSRAGRCAWGASASACSRSQNHPRFLQSLRAAAHRAAPTGNDRRRRARPHPRSRAGRAALQRVPPAVRAAAAHQLRRLRRPRAWPAGRAASAPSRSGWSAILREVYGQHRCDASQGDHDARSSTPTATPINDCLGHAGRQRSWTTSRTSTRSSAGSPSSTRPHGFAISETQLQVFILERLAPAVQRPLLHLELPPRVLRRSSACAG